MKILLVHFRFGKTDGVSIEMSFWKQILERNGHKVISCSGPVNEGADFVIDKLEQQLDPLVFSLNEQAFGGKTSYSKAEFQRLFKSLRRTIEKDFDEVLQKSDPDRIIISNIFSVGENVGAAQALLGVLDRYKIPTLLVNHDFYWENIRYRKPAYDFIENTLEKHFTPKRAYIRHACINSIAKSELKKRKNIDAQLIYDTIDFKQNPWLKDEYNQDLLDDYNIRTGDIVVLQATRVVRRKNIELAVDFVRLLEKTLNKINYPEITLYNSERFVPGKSRIHLVLAGHPEKRDQGYFRSLLSYAERQNVNVCYIGDRISERANKNGVKHYSLWDTYAFADLITYPSEYEGFGNQLLEAVFAEKPIALFEYPVFKTDIKPKGFNYIGFGDRLDKTGDGFVALPSKALESAVTEAIEVLTSQDLYKNITRHNKQVGERYFSFETTEKVLEKALMWDANIANI